MWKKPICPLTQEWIKESVVYTYSRALFTLCKRISAIYNNMDELSAQCAKRNKPFTERQIPIIKKSSHRTKDWIDGCQQFGGQKGKFLINGHKVSV